MSIKTLLENSVLNEETKVVVQEAFDAAIAQKELELQEQFDVKLEAELLEVTANIQESSQEAMKEVVAEEMAAIAEELKEARALEVTYATQLNEFKEDYAKHIQEQVDMVTAEVVAEEISELKEDIEYAKRHAFTQKLFESFKETYEREFGGANDVHSELEEARAELDALRRTTTIAGLLESISGDKRKVAETILENTATDKLEEKFESIKSFLLVEQTQDEKEVDSLTEGTTVVEGEEVEALEESTTIDHAQQRLLKSLKHI